MQGGSNIRLVEAVVERLLTSAVADMAVPVRRTVLESMKQMSDLDAYLAQADWSVIPHSRPKIDALRKPLACPAYSSPA